MDLNVVLNSFWLLKEVFMLVNKFRIKADSFQVFNLPLSIGILFLLNILPAVLNISNWSSRGSLLHTISSHKIL